MARLTVVVEAAAICTGGKVCGLACAASRRFSRDCASSLTLPLGYSRMKLASCCRSLLERTRVQLLISRSSCWSCSASVKVARRDGNR